MKTGSMIALLAIALCHPVAAIVLGEDLNTSEFNDVLSTCSYPEVARNDTCTCAAGFTWKNSFCGSCEAGKYKPDDGLHACTSCPEHHFSFENATELEDCVCTYGYEPDDAYSMCRACESGFYKDFLGNNSCLACAANASTLTQHGASITASTLASDCRCLPGFEGSFDSGCNACAVDYFKASDTPDQACTACTTLQAHLATLGPASDDAADCVCEPGFFLASGVCTPCVAGTYKPEIANLPACRSCPPNSSSTSASTNIEDCVCGPGFFRDPSVEWCSVCTEGYFCGIQGLRQKCTEYSHSIAGATSSDECICRSSWYKVAGTCFACPPDFFCPGDDTKHACPENSEASANSTSLSDCVCDGGFEKRDSAASV